MKQFCFALLLSLLFKVSFAQCRISGTISGKIQGLVELILLYGDGHYEIPSIELKVNSAGRFSRNLEINQPVFALLRSTDWQQRLLLTPDRDLQIRIQPESGKLVSFSGAAAEENELTSNSILDSIPFFMKEPYKENPFSVISAAEWSPRIIDQINSQIKTATLKITGSKIPDELKQLLISETRYAWQCHLNDLTNNNMSWMKNPDRDSLLELAMKFQQLPDSNELRSGFYANMILGRQIQYQINKAAQHAKRNKKKMQDTIGKLFCMPFEEIDSLVTLYGERYTTSWFYAKNHFAASLQDKLLFNKIIDAGHNASFNTCFYLMDTMAFYFPNSRYLPLAKQEVNIIRQRLNLAGTNPSIRFRTPGSINSLADLVKPYSGKIIYLDIWGTWCGPCRIEMKYVKELKQRFKGKEVVFVYLDMDDDLKDSSWKEYLAYYNIEGEHYRLNKQQIQPLWKELKAAGGKEGLYPSFVIFGRDGKIIHADAQRPSSLEKLYLQLDKVL